MIDWNISENEISIFTIGYLTGCEGEFDLKEKIFSPWKQQDEGSLEMFVKVCGEIIVFPGAKPALCMYYILWK